jgi:hypothetical protein
MARLIGNVLRLLREGLLARTLAIGTLRRNSLLSDKI